MTARIRCLCDDMIIDRYQQHGLQSNPFAIPPGPQQAATVFIDRGVPDPPPPGSATLVQVIGQAGHGKTTQVFAWQNKTPAPYHYVPQHPYRTRWTPPPVAALVYGDEIDRMPRLLRQRWFRRLAKIRATVVVGTHSDLTASARRAGLTVRTHRLGSADLATVTALVSGRVSEVEIEDSPVHFELTDADIRDIHRAANGSLRDAEVLAHELVALRVHASHTHVL